MSQKRRDNRNRVLRNGESQRPDGRYRYTYTDSSGAVKDIYSWKLEPGDKTPAGKRDSLSLREQIRELQKKDFAAEEAGRDMTFLDLAKRYVATKTGLRFSTEAEYAWVLRKLEKDPFSKRRIGSIRSSDAKLWFIRLQKEENLSYGSIHVIKNVVMPAFRMAIDDDILTKNPFNFDLSAVLVNDSTVREALSETDKRRFLEFVKNDGYFQRYYDGIFLLFNTGMRVSEFAGLTVRDLDMRKREINIDHQLQRKNDGTYIILPTKTSSGTRILPMSDEVYECCRRIIDKRDKPAVEPVIDGCTGFVLFARNGMPMTSDNWDRVFASICEKYNKTHKVQMPAVTPHVCRHTYCSDMAKRGMNPKVLQYLMGHSDISVTLNTYTHLKLEDAKKEIDRLEKTG